MSSSCGLTRSQLTAAPLGFVGFAIGMFAEFDRQRDPPHSGKVRHVRLITIKTSHYCEKVRWVLDLVEADTTSPIYYTEDPHPPLFHAFASVKASNDRGSQTPCVIVESGQSREFMNESVAIQRYFLQSAYPTGIQHSVQKMEDYLDAKLGPPVRCLVHCYLLLPENQRAAIAAAASNTTKIEHCLFAAMFPCVICPKFRKLLNCSSATASDCKDSIYEIFDFVSNRLQENGGRYIMDDSDSQSYGFTAADLTFAALVSPLLQPEEHPLYSGNLPSAAPLFACSATLRATPAGKHALRMYREHRRPPGSPTGIKSVDRNRSLARLWPWQAGELMAFATAGHGDTHLMA